MGRSRAGESEVASGTTGGGRFHRLTSRAGLALMSLLLLAGRFASFALLAVLVILPLRAEAQTAYVSNSDSVSNNDGTAQSTSNHGQLFVTGSQADGYPLGGIGLFPSVALSQNSFRNLTVSIYSVTENDLPDSVVYELNNPTVSVAADAEARFTAPVDATLSADTKYIVTVEPQGGYNRKFYLADDGSENSDASAGWSIRDNRVFKGVSNLWVQSDSPLAISVYPPFAALSNDATLSALALADTNDNAVSLNETFDAATMTYTADVGNAVDTITVTPTVNQEDATYAILDSNDAELTDADGDGANGFQVSLGVGETTFKVEVTAEDTTSTETYIVTVTRAANTDATGVPTISGTPQVGQTLTAGMGTVSDADGLTMRTFPDDYSFQWVLDGTDISSATTQTYTPVAGDIGKTLKVEVSFTDDAGNAEELPSDATAAVVRVAETCEYRLTIRGHDWCTTMAVGVESRSSGVGYGYSAALYGQLADRTIDYGPSYRISEIRIFEPNSQFTQDSVIVDLDAHVPSGSLFDLGGTTFTATSSAETVSDGYQWLRPLGFAWLDGQTVTVSANLAPGIESAAVDGTSLVLTYAEDLNTTSRPAASAYTVTVDGTGQTPTGVAVSGQEVTLTLGTAVTSGQTVTVSYAVPSSNPLRDLTSLDAPALTDYGVTNDTASTASDDAALSGLVLNDGTNDVTLSPTFTSSTTSYAANVGNAVDAVTVTPTVNQEDATHAILDSNDAALDDADGNDVNGFQVALAEGDTTFKVEVTAEDTTSKQTYTVKVTRAYTLLWSATMTVGAPESDVHGYREGQGGSFAAGETGSFTYAGTGNSVLEISRSGLASAYDPEFYFAVNKRLAGDQLTLEVAGEELPLKDAEASADGTNFIWSSDWLTTNAPSLDDDTWVETLPVDGMVGVCLRTADRTCPEVVILSPVATLDMLTVNDGSGDLVLNPPFSNDTFAYPVTVRNAVDQITVSVMKSHSAATVSWLDADDMALDDAAADDGFQVDLEVGDTIFKVKVTAEDGETMQTFVFTVTRSQAYFCAAPDLAGRTEVWSGDVTVAALTAGYGFIEGSGGGLTDKGFDLGTGSYTIDTLYASDVQGGSTLYFGLTGPFPDPAETVEERLELHVCGDTFGLDDATYRGSPVHTYAWPSAGILDDWSNATVMQAALSMNAPVSTPATGNLEISGRAQVGQTLTVSQGRIADANGLPAGSFPWGSDIEWFRVPVSGEDADISVGTGATYLLMAADVGSVLRAEVTFTDGGGFEETVSGSAGPVVASSTALFSCSPLDLAGTGRRAVWSGTVTVGYDNPHPSRPDWRTGYLGYAQAGGDTFPRVAQGGLSGKRTFTHGGEDYTVESVVRYDVLQKRTGRDGDGNLVYTDLDPPLPVMLIDLDRSIDAEAYVEDDLKFHVCGHMLTGGSYTQSSKHSPGGRYSWTLEPATVPPGPLPVDFNWQVGDRVEVALSTTSAISSGAQQSVGRLTAEFVNAPASHDGVNPFTVEIEFSETPRDAGGSPLGMADDALREILREGVAGGAVTGVRRANLDGSLRRVTIRPDGTGPVTVSLEPSADCGEAESLCTASGGTLETPISLRVEGPGGPVQDTAAAPLTARFENVPAMHDGSTPFTVEIRFSEPPHGRVGQLPGMRNGALRRALEVTGGTATRLRRVNGVHTHRIVTVEPAGPDAVTVALSPRESCDMKGAVCTEDGRALSAPVLTIVQGPPGLSVADAEVEEGPDAVLAFAVTLDRPVGAAVTVDYATADATAQAGSDYRAASGTLAFAAGEVSKTIRIAVLDDAHDEGAETMTLALSNPSGAYLLDGEATGTIENSDPMPEAWLGRFGRTVAEQVLDAVDARMRAAPAAGMEVTVAGQRLGGGAPDAEALEEAEAQARLAALSDWVRGEACRDGAECPAGPGGRSRALTGRDLLTGSAFALTGGSAEGGYATLWGRGAVSRFDGREGELSLDGEVASVLLGTDWTRERWTAGLLLSHARGEGGYQASSRSERNRQASSRSERNRGADSGAVDSTLTGLYPWGRYAMTDRVDVWGAAGFGAGTLTLTPEGKDPLETDMDLMMAAAGLRGVVVEAPEDGGPELAVKTDAMAVRTSSDALTDTAGGNLAASTADVTRLRLGLEGIWRGLVLGTGTLAPRLDIGVRHDGGDAETGFGLDLGAGLAWSDPETGFSAEASGRGLLTHEAGGFGQRGFAGRLGWDPRPGTDRGPSLSLTQSLGLAASGGADALLGRPTLEGLAAADDGDELDRRRLEVGLGYGFAAFGDRFTATPEAGLAMSVEHREYRLGWRLSEERRAGLVFGLDVEGARREPAAGEGEPSHRLGFGFGWRLEGAGTTAFELRFEGARIEAANDDDGPEHRLGLRTTARW